MIVNPEEPFTLSERRGEVVPLRRLTGRPHERLATDDLWMQSRDVAKRLGIKTQTLAKWRLMGKGPQGWKRVAPNVVLYPASAVREYEEEKGLVYSKAN
jgi:hypothetical protein